MKREMIDLHTHSSNSDGSDNSSELIIKAYKRGLRAVALTDHDTIVGLDEAELQARQLGIEFVRGVELSAKTELGEVHILGLFLPNDAERTAVLEKVLVDLRIKRDERNDLILQKLQALGVDITADEIFVPKKCNAIGRPHFASLLLKKQVVRSYGEAFEKYLGKRGLAYVSKAKLEAQEAIVLLRGLGAVVSLAHPMLNFNNVQDLERLLPSFVDYGMQAIEAYHTEHSSQDTRTVVSLADRYNLALTGGSDYHGVYKSKVQLGVGKGSLYVPYYLLEKLKAKLQA